MVHDLAELAEALRSSPGWQAKAHIAVVRDVFGAGDWLRGPGDDGAAVSVGSEEVIACGEAILPRFVERDPYGAGVAAVLTNVNDVAAMGAVPVAIVDTVVGPPETRVAPCWTGCASPPLLYDVPVVGGHLTISADRVALSAFALGRCPGRPLSATRVAPGQRLALVVCLEGKMRPDFPFFPSFDERGRELAGDVRLLADLAAGGVVEAAKDVSMAGLFGSLAMLLEPTRCGASIPVEAVPVPAGLDFDAWSLCFPCFSFLVTMAPGSEDRCRRAVERRGLTYAPLATVDASGVLGLTDDGDCGGARRPQRRRRHGALSRQVDRHRDVGDPDVDLLVPGHGPTEVFEEGDVARLDVRGHETAAAPRRRGDGEPHQRGTEAVTARTGEDGQPIALPVTGVVEGIETHRAPGDVVAEPQHLDGGRLVVVTVTIGAREQALLADEHHLTDAVVLGHHRGVVGDAAGDAGAVQDVSHARRRACARSGAGPALRPWASTPGSASTPLWPSPHRGHARSGTASPGARCVRRRRAVGATSRP